MNFGILLKPLTVWARQFEEPKPWSGTVKTALAVSVIGALILVASEADHTSDLPLLVAITLWVSHLMIALLIFTGTRGVLQNWPIHDVFVAPVSLLLVSFLFAPVSLLLDIGLGKPDAEIASGLSLTSIYLIEVTAVAPTSIAVVVVFLLVFYRIPRLSETTEITPTTDALHPVPPLRQMIDGVPKSLGEDIVRLQAQDHYVEIVTTEGRDLLMLKFTDCVEKLEPLNGFQCHRSHWISLKHCRAISSSGSAYVCQMSNGDKVPLSRRKYSQARERLSSRAMLK